MFVLVAALSAHTGVAQEQPNCPPGSPCATTTIDGKQLPLPPQKFEGKIERNAAQSKTYWPARVVPPKGAPADIQKLQQAERNNKTSE